MLVPNPAAKPFIQVDLEMLSSPDCPVEAWWTMAAIHPWEATQSPLFGVLTLEAPERWMTLENEYMGSWVVIYAKKLSPKDQRLFMADIIEKRLPEYETLYPDELRPRQSMEAGRAFALGQITEEQMEAASFEVKTIASGNSFNFKAYFALAASWVSESDRQYESRNRNAYGGPVIPYIPANLAVVACISHSANHLNGEAYWAFVRWQWHRLQDYLQGGS